MSSFVQGRVNTTLFSLGAGHPETWRVHHTVNVTSLPLNLIYTGQILLPFSSWGLGWSSRQLRFLGSLPSLTFSSVSAYSNNTYLSVTSYQCHKFYLCHVVVFLTFCFVCTAFCKALFSPKRTVQGRQSIQLGKRTFSKLTSYKTVKAILFVHISLERKEWISYNDVSCIM